MNDERKKYCVGVDVGAEGTPSGIAVVAEGEKLSCLFIETVPAGTGLTTLTARLAEITEKLKETGAVRVVVDVTDHGEPLFKLMKRNIKGKVYAARFTAREPVKDGENWKIPKTDLVTNLKILIQKRELELPGKGKNEKQDEAIRETVAEMQTFNPAPAGEGHPEVRTGKRDNLVTALGLACWAATEWPGVVYGVWTS